MPMTVCRDRAWTAEGTGFYTGEGVCRLNVVVVSSMEDEDLSESMRQRLHEEGGITQVRRA